MWNSKAVCFVGMWNKCRDKIKVWFEKVKMYALKE